MAPQLDAARGEALRAAPARASGGAASILLATTICGLAATARIEQRQLAVDDVEVVERIAAAHAAGVEQMQRAGGARHVAEEAVAEAVARVRAFDQAGDVGEDEGGVLVDAHDAEVRDERGERVVGDARPRRRDAADEGRLADVGEAEQADVGDQVQLERGAGAPRPSSPGCARARRLVGRGLVGGVAAPAAAAAGDDDAGVWRGRGRRSPRPSRRRARSCRVGTRATTSAPRWPCCSLPRPCSPRLARRRGWYLKSSSVVRLGSTSSTTSPPSPPLPPSGPPLGRYFSRRKLTQPAPPCPPRTSISASSTNFMVAVPPLRRRPARCPSVTAAAGRGPAGGPCRGGRTCTMPSILANSV